MNKNLVQILTLIFLFYSITSFMCIGFQINWSLSNGFYSNGFSNSSNDKECCSSQILSLAQDSDINDTEAPIITFVQPFENNTIISSATYTIIVNISDDNVPSYGNVTLQLSNYNSSYFNVSMNSTEGNLWSYDWNNISLYPNQAMYIFQVWALDSSINRNGNWSEEFYVLMFRSTPFGSSPIFINFIIYLIVVCAILAVIVVYVNKRALFISSRKRKK